MKKTLFILFVVALLFSFVGCTLHNSSDMSSTNPPSTNKITESTAESITEEILQKPMIAVSLPAVEQTQAAEDGTVIFRYSYRNMSLIVPDPEVADKIIVDFLNRIDHTTELAQQISDAAKAAYTGSSQWTPYLCQIGYDPMRLDTGILSLLGSYAAYSGTPHPEKSYLSVNYDLLTGNLLRLDDILTADSTTDTLYQYVIDALTVQKSENYLYDGFEAIVRERFDRKSTSDDCWYFSQTGLCFYFSPYEIAPYASGMITAEIPYSKLVGVLDDAYFPTEAEYTSSKITADIFNENDLDQFTQFAEVVMDTDGSKILLHTDGAIANIRIESGSWNAGGTIFTPEQTVFAAYSLTPGDAIMVDAIIDDTLPNLRLSYSTANEIAHKYITMNNGQPVLIEQP